MLAWQNSWRRFGMPFANTGLMVAEGVADGSYRGEFHTLVTGDDLFVE